MKSFQNIGILGNGQLGRLFALESARLGFRTVAFGPGENAPAAQVSNLAFAANYDDRDSLNKWLDLVDVITYEFENIPIETIEWIADRKPVFPAPDVIYTCQNREREKVWLEKNHFPVVPYRPVQSANEVEVFIKDEGYPVVIKTAGFGYDGKGQTLLQNPEDLSRFTFQPNHHYIVEKWLQSPQEGSLIVARSHNQLEMLGPFFNTHLHHILDTTLFPSPFEPSVVKDMQDLARAIAEKFVLRGLLCVEFFIQNRQVYVNEMAPRPHNSGHLTLDLFETSQFEQHLRAVVHLPLARSSLTAPAGCMANLLGEHLQSSLPPFVQNLSPKTHFYWYGKSEIKRGRKMGHLNYLAETPELAYQQAILERKKLSSRDE